jgi:transcriptional regulator with XRE-family HTH domain
MSLPAQLKAARLRLGLTQAEAAAVCGVSARAYWQWEAGKSTLDVTLEGALERLLSEKKRPPRKGPNAEDESRAASARTLHPLVGSLDGDK